MTSSSRSALICECGHKGNIVLRENDQPFSGLWENYSLEGFAGGTIIVTNYKDTPKDMIAALKPTCPQCRESGKVKYA
jgi:hypothetical protein